MAETYNFKEIESKWQKRWQEENLFAVRDNVPIRKMYVLDMFPYPSGDGLHVGHVKIYTASDVVSRYLRMKGFNVLHPTGWDAFGLPTENTAIKKKIHPADLTKQNIERFRKQMQMMGFSYDWSREINTTDPSYMKWTQWIFIKLFNMGLAYEDTIPINWCPSCKTGLANEEVEDSRCERCGTEVEQKPIRQWMLRITKYADRLLQGLDGLDWPDFILDMQRNWIGKSVGVEIDFRILGANKKLKVFTTRLDTLHGATFVVVSSEHPLVASLLKIQNPKSKIQNVDEVRQYIQEAKQRPEMERVAEDREKTGIELKGVQAINPVNGEKLPVWVADYVLMTYGTGAIMAVPAHDERDFEFAQRYKLSVVQVIQPKLAAGETKLPYVGEGVLINSGEHSGRGSEEARRIVMQTLQIKGAARRRVHYALRDWVFSRQRYWGEPIPIIHCESCGAVPVPEQDLPVELPSIDRYEPTGEGESPLAGLEEWVKVKCPTCPAMGRRETNTMPQWAGSSWYWLRYTDPGNEDEIAGRSDMEEWLPVDLYVGGAEHAVLHLLYARFWNMALFDQDIVSRDEPFMRFRSVGLLLGEDGEKMSKSRGNVINPDDVVEKVGVDAVRVYSMFMGPFGNAMPWSDTSVVGAARFLRRVWNVFDRLTLKKTSEDAKSQDNLELQIHSTIRRVSEGTEQFRFNTAIAALMELLNEMEKKEAVSREVLETYVLLLAPYAPHLAEELWEKLGHGESLTYYEWPKWDEALLDQAVISLPVQVNGKVRGELEVVPGMTEEKVKEAAIALDNVAKYVKKGKIERVVYVDKRMINFVVSK